ncbi:methylated-DNA--[protein]-cysteine S-methyltransferase [Methylobacillus methanolivorans]|uniref:Methylated-DNA--[protein]-cysteine S-methyltransferase n=1 Tax=Methylobacillus methanolivorans TaxID=1848927 RepID=A0ABW8GI92_9PROT
MQDDTTAMNSDTKPMLHADMIAEACRLLDENPAMLLSQLAGYVGLSQFHFHRVFKATMGLTPKQYANAVRMRKARESLQQGVSVTEAIYESGFNTASRFYAQAEGAMGMTPSSYKQGGAGQALHYGFASCSLGKLIVAVTAKGIAAILLGDSTEALLTDLRAMFPRAELLPGENGFYTLLAEVVTLIDEPSHVMALPLDIQGTVFQQRVWTLLRSIPPGQTLSYSELAQQLGAPRAVRAVASACAANKLAVAIPCHRVVRTDGKLAGYRWGLHRKQALLDKESQ